MEERFISIEECCNHYSVETEFIEALEEHGLLSFVKTESAVQLSFNQLPHLERCIRLHYDLDINYPGMVAIEHLLAQVHELQAEMRRLRGL
ncbi:MAG: hypothetical protein H6567_07280 [Lewinellaceae bacterium]|nr:hypothetical protein [Lewinellaceae bacterium]